MARKRISKKVAEAMTKLGLDTTGISISKELTVPRIRPNTVKQNDGKVIVTINKNEYADFTEFKLGNGFWQSYTGPITVNQNVVIQARYKHGDKFSPIASLKVANI